MATKTLSLDETAYERLKKMKKPDESFSDVVKRITSERSLLEISGIWSDNELRDIIEENRRRTRKELDETAEELS